MIPDFVTHYYLPDRTPFRSLSELEEPLLTELMRELIAQRHQGRHHRLFGRTYMDMRRIVEARLYRKFVEAGGRPERASPHYFVLGESAWFGGLAPGMREVRLSLDALPDGQTSITYPDSFAAMEVAPEFGLPHEPRPYHGLIFRLDQLTELVDTYGLPRSEPDENYTGYELRTAEKYVEVQLWSDEPIRAYVS